MPSFTADELLALGVEACLLKPVKQTRLLEALSAAVTKTPPTKLAVEPASKPELSLARLPLHVLVAEDNVVRRGREVERERARDDDHARDDGETAIRERLGRGRGWRARCAAPAL